MLLSRFPTFYPKCFMSDKKAPCNERNLDLNKPFDFQPIT